MNLPTSPDQMNEFFARAYNSGEIKNLTTLFEQEAKTVTIQGETLSGVDDIQKDLNKLLKLGGKMTSVNKYTVQFEDIALLRADWTIETIDDQGETITISGSSSEVVRKQKNGTWLYVIDLPVGASSEV